MWGAERGVFFGEFHRFILSCLCRFFKEAVWSACFSGFWGVCNKPMFIHRCQYAYVEELVRVAVGNLVAVRGLSVRLCLRACSGGNARRQ